MLSSLDPVNEWLHTDDLILHFGRYLWAKKMFDSNLDIGVFLSDRRFCHNWDRTQGSCDIRFQDLGRVWVVGAGCAAYKKEKTIISSLVIHDDGNLESVVTVAHELAHMFVDHNSLNNLF